MPSSVVEINGPVATNAPFSDLGAEEAVVNAAKRGNEQAFEILVRCHQPRILALALRYTRVREDAEDVVQQSFQKAFVHLHKFEGKSSFSTWLTRIAINEALMWLRRVRSLREVPVDASNSNEAARSGLRRTLREILRRYIRSPRMSRSRMSGLAGNASRISQDRLAPNARAQSWRERRHNKGAIPLLQ